MRDSKTGLAGGDEFGGAHTIVGSECDGCEFTPVEGRPQPTGRDGTPENFTILGTAPAQWHPDDSEWYDAWQPGHRGHAVMGYYQPFTFAETISLSKEAVQAIFPACARVSHRALASNWPPFQ